MTEIRFFDRKIQKIAKLRKNHLFSVENHQFQTHCILIKQEHSLINADQAYNILISQKLYQPTFELMKCLNRHSDCIDIACNYIKDSALCISYIQQNLSSITQIGCAFDLRRRNTEKFDEFLLSLFDTGHILAIDIAKTTFIEEDDVIKLYSAFKNLCPTTSIWSFLRYFQ